LIKTLNGRNDGTFYTQKRPMIDLYRQSSKNDVCIQPISDSSFTNRRVHPFRHGLWNSIF